MQLGYMYHGLDTCIMDACIIDMEVAKGVFGEVWERTFCEKWSLTILLLTSPTPKMVKYKGRFVMSYSEYGGGCV